MDDKKRRIEKKHELDEKRPPNPVPAPKTKPKDDK